MTWNLQSYPTTVWNERMRNFFLGERVKTYSDPPTYRQGVKTTHSPGSTYAPGQSTGASWTVHCVYQMKAPFVPSVRDASDTKHFCQHESPLNTAPYEIFPEDFADFWRSACVCSWFQLHRHSLWRVRRPTGLLKIWRFSDLFSLDASSSRKKTLNQTGKSERIPGISQIKKNTYKWYNLRPVEP